MLEFRNVTFQYDVEDFNIIDDLSFHIGKGEFVSVIGPSGCGKSTIFRLTGQLLTRTDPPRSFLGLVPGHEEATAAICLSATCCSRGAQ